jgi:hypothetical protein
MTDRLKMQDPRTQYPRPPFPRQPQPHPGLAAKMAPVPDHGETSYRGSGKLEGRKALVTGGDSGIGRAAAIAFAREGADVAIAYLPEEEPDAKAVMALIQAEGRKAIALPGYYRRGLVRRTGRQGCQRPGRAGHPGDQCRASADAKVRRSGDFSRLRPNHED